MRSNHSEPTLAQLVVTPLFPMFHVKMRYDKQYLVNNSTSIQQIKYINSSFSSAFLFLYILVHYTIDFAYFIMLEKKPTLYKDAF
jgi:hypothetical protein